MSVFESDKEREADRGERDKREMANSAKEIGETTEGFKDGQERGVGVLSLSNRR